MRIRVGLKFLTDYTAKSDYRIKALLVTFPVNITQDIWSAASPAYEVPAHWKIYIEPRKVCLAQLLTSNHVYSRYSVLNEIFR